MKFTKFQIHINILKISFHIDLKKRKKAQSIILKTRRNLDNASEHRRYEAITQNSIHFIILSSRISCGC